jgi:hypothetical protein
VTTTLARYPHLAFNAATAHWRDSGCSSSVISRTLSLGMAQIKRNLMHETRTRTRSAGSFDAAGPFHLGRSDCANFPANDVHEPHEVMTSGRTVEIANGQ